MKAPTPLKVISLNTHKGFSVFNRRFVLPALRDAIRTSGADIALLQEVIGEHQLHAANVAEWPDVPQYEYLADTIWSQHAYGRNAIYGEGHHGNAVLSKLPIVRWHNTDVSVRGPEQRGLLHCEIDVDGWPPLHIICVHLGLMEAHRRIQLHRMADLVNREIPPDAALLIGGDFNDWRISAHRILADRAGLREAFVETQGQAAKTFPVKFPMLRLDRVYTRGLKVRRAEVLAGRPWSHLSDHAALVVEVLPS